MLCKDINNLIIYLTIDKCDNLLLNQLSQVMLVNFNMLHLSMCNMIINYLYCTLIVIVKNSRGFDRKPKLTQELLDPNNLSASIDNTMILSFSSRQRDNLRFLRGPDQGSKTKAKNESWSWFPIIIVAWIVGISVANQQLWTLTILDTEVRGTLQILNDPI